MPVSSPSYLTRACQILVVIIGTTVVLYYGRSLLVPLTFALVLAMLLLPLSRRLESWGLHRALAAVVCILLLVGFFVLLFYLLSWQLADVVQNGDQLKQKAAAMLGQAQDYLATKLGLPKSQQKEMLKGGNGNLLDSVSGIVANLLGVVVDMILVLVYMFLMMFFRSHLITALLKAVPGGQQQNVRQVASEAGQVAQQYLLGLVLMIACLWVMYGIGFSIVGVRYALFFALLCGTLELIPFFGNVTGTLATVCMGLLQGGDLNLIVGILITYGSVQFIQSYILQPLIVGGEVNLNPLFTIFCIVVGDAVWGIPGMVLAVPLFGMLKITCDHFEALKPYGYLLGGAPKKRSRSPGWFYRISKIFKS
jgi:predicted PurR-regulated permease PerM